ncbi:unnamed protein product [Prorocentrum cordatum]|uniref:Uncharacterized protein n=1 Tax=Prorocentrum cordatum TaxID=2364126 RepID=A0ABN9QX58_9DINO|nr:unnamed protein product [Polarella glacialis]
MGVSPRNRPRLGSASGGDLPKKRSWRGEVGFDGKVLGAEDLTPLGGLESWRGHPRLQKHLEAFKGASDRARVLERYSEAAVTASALHRKVVLRYACHVGAWTAMLPAEEAVASCGPEGLSPVRVLARLLQHWGKGPLTPWLRGILRLVEERLREVHSTSAGCWEELRQAMPRLRKDRASGYGSDGVHTRAAQKNSLCSTIADKKRALTLKALRKRQRDALIEADGLRGLHREAAIAAALQRGKAALLEEDPDAIVEIVSDCIGFLEPPRRKATRSKEEAMPDEAKDRLRAGVQRKLRTLVLQLFGCLDLQDADTLKLLAVPFGRLCCILRGGGAERPACEAQWLRIRDLAARFEERQEQGPIHAPPPTALAAGEELPLAAGTRKVGTGLAKEAKGHRSIREGRYTPNRQILAFSCVEERQGEEEVLICSGCALEVRTCWY